MDRPAFCLQSTYLWWSADSPSSNSETGPPLECHLGYLLLHFHPYIHPPRDLRPRCCPPLRLSGSLRPSQTQATALSCRCCHNCPLAGARPPLSPAGSASQSGRTATMKEMEVDSEEVSGNEKEAKATEQVVYSSGRERVQRRRRKRRRRKRRRWPPG